MTKHQELEERLGQDNVLVVNSTMEPREIIHWHDAVPMVFSQRAYTLLGRADGTQLHSAYLTFDKPLVISLVKYAQVRNRIINLEDKVSREFILQRDNYTCVYCGKPGRTMDHIFPKSRGGRETWGNLATACRECNGRKADRTPEEANMPRPTIRSGILTNRRLQEVQSLVFEVLTEISN